MNVELPFWGFETCWPKGVVCPPGVPKKVIGASPTVWTGVEGAKGFAAFVAGVGLGTAVANAGAADAGAEDGTVAEGAVGVGGVAEVVQELHVGAFEFAFPNGFAGAAWGVSAGFEA